MPAHNLLELLELESERNLLIQGVPSSMEKQFVKLSYAKSMTPLLCSRKVDFALIFAINHTQLCSILKEVLPAIHVKSILWIAYPRSASKISSDLNRDCSWNMLCTNGYEPSHEIPLDHVWSALRFLRPASKKEEVPSKKANLQTA